MANQNINKANNKPQVLRFAGTSIPLPTESENKSNLKPSDWGSGNNYPFFLLDLYNSSVIHGDIIDQKAVHIWGDGLMNVADKKPFRIKPNSDDTFELFIEKVLKNDLIFNAFAVEVNFNMDGTVNSYINIPIQKVGLSPSKDKIWYYGEDNRQKITYVYDRYDPSRIYDDNKSKVYYYEGYTPSRNYVYPTPQYAKLISTLDTDIKIGNFSNNQISNHFSPSTMINFFNGTDIDDDIKKQVLRDLEASYTGANGKKLLVNWANPNGKSAEIVNIGSGDWADAFLAIKESIQSLIYKGHGITSPALFGDKTEGQLGSSQELINAFEIWNNSYLRVRRTEIESALSDLFGVKIFFQNKPLFSATLSDDIKKSVYTINELRAEQGKEPIANGDRIIGEAVAPTTPNQFSNHVCIQCAGEDDDYDKILHLGAIEDDYEEVEGDVFSAQLRFDNESDIAQFILDNEITGVSSAELRALIKKELGIEITTSGLKELITNLGKAGVISQEVRDGKFIIKVPVVDKKKEAEQRTIMTMYKYTLREDVEGPDLLPTSRGFCVQLIKSGKLFSKIDLSAMSAIYGWTIEKHTGGFWKNSNTGETFDHCRHYFKALSVIKKVK